MLDDPHQLHVQDVRLPMYYSARLRRLLKKFGCHIKQSKAQATVISKNVEPSPDSKQCKQMVEPLTHEVWHI